MKIILKIRDRGKRGFDISSVPIKKLMKCNDNYRRKKWELIDKKEAKWLILEAY